MVQKALAYAKANGTDKLVAAVNAKSPEFDQGELYVVVVDATDNVQLAHPVDPQLVGINADDMQDIDGTEFGKDMLEMVRAHGKGWIGYMYKNPVTNRTERKMSYVEMSGDIYAVAGIYKP